jgi:hypothetical protein
MKKIFLAFIAVMLTAVVAAFLDSAGAITGALSASSY